MSNEIANTQETAISVPQQQHDDSIFEQVSSSGKYLPRLQLYGSNSDKAKEGVIQSGHYGLTSSKDQIDDLGKEVDVLIVSWRPKALDISGEEIIASYNPNSELFKNIQQRADVPNSSCMFGPEFLVYIPDKAKWATLMMGSKSARREAPNVKSHMGQFATLKVTLAANKRYKWHATVVSSCSTAYDVPADEEIKEKVENFLNPPENENEPVEEAASSDRKR